MSKRIIVTGGSGLLGRAVAACFEDTTGNPTGLKYEVQRWVFNRIKDEKRDKRVDISKKEEVFAAIQEFKPDAIIHCAAIRAPDIVSQQRDFARSINVLGSQYVAEAATGANAKLIYISTDYVFDGTKPPHAETDEPNPLNDYGKQKLEGERVTLEFCPSAIILRVPILYGPVEFLGEGAVDGILQAILRRDKPAELSHYERRYPTHVSDVAAVIRLLLERYFEQTKSEGADPQILGIYHWSGDEEMTKYDMAKAMTEVLSLPSDHLVANTDAPPPQTATQRPYNAKLGCKRLLDLGARNRYTFKEGIKGALERFVNPQ